MQLLRTVAQRWNVLVDELEEKRRETARNSFLPKTSFFPSLPFRSRFVYAAANGITMLTQLFYFKS
jgi:hypothetical protein